jgi:uncharacterized MnhB-related membrane protein
MQEKESKTNRHFWISMVKSIIRIGACYFLFQEQFGNAAISFALAEVLGYFNYELLLTKRIRKKNKNRSQGW